jgi:hypothetical protein
MNRFDPLPLGTALFLLGLGIAAITFMSISQPDVDYARTQWTALLAMGLATPAIALYVLEGGPPGPWWRAFWTAGLAAYLVHSWWSVFVTYHGDFGAIAARQGWVAYTNFAVTILWLADAILAWLMPRSQVPARVGLRFVAWVGVTASFIAAAAIFREGTVQQLGMLLAIIVIAALLLRYLGLVRWADSG